MRFRYKGRRYKVNTFPILVAFLILVALIVFGVSSCTKKDVPPPSGAAASGSLPVSDGLTDSGGSSAAGSDGGASSDGGILVGGSSEGESSAEAASPAEAPSAEGGAVVPADLPAGSPADWNLILLNPDEENKLEQDLDIEKTKFDEMWVDSRAAPAYKQMCDAAAAEGVTLYLRSGYRSIATQRTNFDNNVKAEMAKGNNEAEATRLTKLYFTVPGHSEHHSGLAFDIITPEYHHDVYELNETFANDENYNAAYKWLVKNCAEYGFILRYPKDKEEITHINFEPWHYRYVGVEHARYIMSHGLCLEEYLALLKAAGR